MNVLVVVAHPDDETLGMGGTIRKHADRGDEVAVCVGVTERTRETTTDHHHEFELACAVLGIPTTRVQNLGLSDQRFEETPVTEIVRSLEEQWFPYEPDLIYTHNPDDLNRDHRIVCEAVLVAFRPHVFKGTILAFETISSTEWGVEPFQANWYEELVLAQLGAKMDALDCYESELRATPHPRNATGINVLARVRGHQCGVEYAEAFRLLRKGPR